VVHYKYIFIIILANISLNFGQLYSEIVLVGYYHLFKGEDCEPYGELLITDFDEATDKREVLLNIYPLEIYIPDKSTKDDLIEFCCMQLQDLALEYNVDSIGLFIHATTIGNKGIESIAKLAQKNHLKVLSLFASIGEKGLNYIHELSPSTNIYLFMTQQFSAEMITSDSE
jgi:hypothetical protein